jgi:dTMP kinase
MNRGRFVTLEGIDGAGKSTHVQALAHRLARGGAEVVVTREPGGTPLAESLRAHLLEQPMDTLTEALLVFAARRDHLRHVIEPALERGATVLCDRFTDATFAYQGAGRGLDVELLLFLESKVQEGRQPDLTLWFDVPASVAAQRRSAARDPDRFEQLDEAFFERVRAGYAQRANHAAQRFARMDARQDHDAVWRDIERVLTTRGW